MKILYIVPRAIPSEIAKRQLQIPEDLLDKETMVEFRAVAFSGNKSDSYYNGAVSEIAVLEAGIDAEADGFDAVCMDTVSDAGLYPLRSRLTIPVVGPGIVGFHIASMLGRRFSIIVTWPRWKHLYERSLTLYGLERKLASIRDLGAPPDLDVFTGPNGERNTQHAIQQAQLAVEEDGADVLMIGSTTMASVVPALRAAVDVPVVNPGPWACKVAESLVKMRVSHSKRAFVSPEVEVDALIHSFAPHRK